MDSRRLERVEELDSPCSSQIAHCPRRDDTNVSLDEEDAVREQWRW